MWLLTVFNGNPISEEARLVTWRHLLCRKPQTQGQSTLCIKKVWHLTFCSLHAEGVLVTTCFCIRLEAVRHKIKGHCLDNGLQLVPQTITDFLLVNPSSIFCSWARSRLYVVNNITRMNYCYILLASTEKTRSYGPYCFSIVLLAGMIMKKVSDLIPCGIKRSVVLLLQLL